MTVEVPPSISVDITYARGQRSYWSYRVNLPDSLRGEWRVSIGVDGRSTTVWIWPIGERAPSAPVIKVMGFGRAMRQLSKYFGHEVRVYSSLPWTCNQTALDLRGDYGVFIPPVPPVVAQVHPIETIRSAYAEHAARMRGEMVGNRFGYCGSDNCANVAAGVYGTEALCKAHEPIPARELADAIALVIANKRVFTAEVKSFGIRREAFARAAAEGVLALVKDGAMTRWVLAPKGVSA